MFYCRLYQFACYVTASSCIVISYSPCRIKRFRCLLKRPEKRHLRVLCFKGSSILAVSQKELHSALTQELHSTLPQSEGAPFYFVSVRMSSILLWLRRSSILLCLSQKKLHSALPHAEGAPFYFVSVRRSSILLCCYQKELHSTCFSQKGLHSALTQKELHSTLLLSEGALFYFVSVRRGFILLWLRRSSILLCCYQKELHSTLPQSQGAPFCFVAIRRSPILLWLFAVAKKER
jgi:hypothetical protein